jgi:DNA-binding transcriptional ArsR family regulator
MTSPHIAWDWGTAYDLFISLEVVHDPGQFGVRGSWAAGVRARLSNSEREILELARPLFHVPFHWIYELPAPKDCAAALWALEQLAPLERVTALALGPKGHLENAQDQLLAVAARGSWSDADCQAIQQACCQGEEVIPAEKLAKILDSWARAEELGGGYLEALRSYHEVFFAEEERRIRPALREALAQAQEMAGRLELPDLLEELSQGVRLDTMPFEQGLVLAPSYWSTPLIFFGMLRGEAQILMFGARPADASLVPGEVVPELLLRRLKALSDPTRLRILYYLAQEPLSQADLARRLRLRAPTVTHHLQSLRLAGLVQVMFSEKKESRQYAVRNEAVNATCHSLHDFLQVAGEKE